MKKTAIDLIENTEIIVTGELGRKVRESAKVVNNIDNSNKTKVNRLGLEVGERFASNNYGDFEIVEVNGTKDIKIRFVDTGYEYSVSKYQVVTGSVMDRAVRGVYGVGFIGLGRHKSSIGGVPTLAYRCWSKMLERCYSKSFHEKRPSYKGVTVSKEWHNFQAFADWFEESHVEGYQLDKDLKSLGKRIYSPETCCFIPQSINAFLVNGKGASFHKRIGQYISYVIVDYRQEHLGYFGTEAEAMESYKFAKGKIAKQIAERETTPENIREPLRLYGDYLINNAQQSAGFFVSGRGE